MTLLGDWSIRSPREPAGPLIFAMGKNFDSSCSLGPCIAVGEADPFDTDVETLVNGERRQRFNTRDMVFSFGEYLEYLSRDLTLLSRRHHQRRHRGRHGRRIRARCCRTAPRRPSAI